MEIKKLTRQEQAKITGHARYVKAGSWWHMSDLFHDHPNLDWKSFRYVHMTNPPSHNSRPPVSILEAPKKSAFYSMVSFFSGCGGMDLGFERAGFFPLAAIEPDHDSCQTYRMNHQKAIVIGYPDAFGEISDIQGTCKGLTLAGIKAPYNGVFVGCPPNEYLSMLFVQYIRMYKPIAFFMASPKITDRVKKEFRSLSSMQYDRTSVQETPDSYFGTPRTKTMDIIAGSRVGAVIHPNKDIYGVGFKGYEYASYPNATHPRRYVYCWKPLLEPMEGLTDAEIPDMRVMFFRDISMLKYGQKSGISEFYRIHPSHEVEMTEVPSCVHPFIPRKLTIREYARLSGFPDDYKFYGDYMSKYRQIFNSISPLTAYYYASRIRIRLDKPMRK